jgi:O-methyltransferase
MLRTLYKLTQSSLGKVGIYAAAARLSARSVPELVNRAIWRPFVADDRWRALYKSTQARTKGDATDNIFRQCRFYSTFQMAEYAASLAHGDVIECGCWHGHSTLAIAMLLAARGFTGRFHVFDSFEGGLSDFKAEDESFFQLSEEEKRAQIRQFSSDFAFVQSVTAPFPFVELHRGWIPEVLAQYRPQAIRFVHIDVDMYEPTKGALEYFWDSLVAGGCIVIDDYNHSVFEGASRAVDEFLKDKTPRLFYQVPLGSAFIIK